MKSNNRYKDIYIIITSIIMKASIYQWEIAYWIDLSSKWAMVIEIDNSKIDHISKWKYKVEEWLYKSILTDKYIQDEEFLQDNK